MGGGSGRHVGAAREVTLAPGKAVDLGAIDLKLTPIARLSGKEPPAWHITDARGVPKDVRPSDFKGKWVVLEFWGYLVRPVRRPELARLDGFRRRPCGRPRQVRDPFDPRPAGHRFRHARREAQADHPPAVARAVAAVSDPAGYDRARRSRTTESTAGRRSSCSTPRGGWSTSPRGSASMPKISWPRSCLPFRPLRGSRGPSTATSPWASTTTSRLPS